LAQNFALVRACSGFTWTVSYCEELVGVTHNPPVIPKKVQKFWLWTAIQNCRKMDFWSKKMNP